MRDRGESFFDHSPGIGLGSHQRFSARPNIRDPLQNDATELPLMLTLGIPRMFVLLGFVALIFSLGAAPAAFALEPSVSFAVDGSIDGQAAFLSVDVVPADSGKGCPYRNCACHAHYVAAIVPQPSDVLPASNAAEPIGMRSSMHASACSGPAPRPPKA